MSWPTLAVIYALQVALLLSVGLLLARGAGLRSPLLRLRYWYGLLALILILPCGIPWSLRALPTPDPSGSTLWSIAGPKLVATVAEAPVLDRPELGRLLLAALALVAALHCFRLALGWLGLRRLKARARPLEYNAPELADLRRQLAPSAELLVSDYIHSPVTFGLRRPIVLVPTAFLDLPTDSQRTIVCHELLHVRRCDWPKVIGEQILSSCLWFHPAVSLLLEKISLCREQVVDREVIQLTGAKRAYLEALRRFADNLSATSPRFPALPFFVPFFQRGHLLQRVTQLTQEVPMSGHETRFTFPALLVTLALTAAAAAALFPWSQAAEAEMIHRVGGEVTKPIRLEAPIAQYPEAGRKEGIEGKVVAVVVIDTDGSVHDVEIHESIGEDFSEETRKALEQWTFSPATLAGEPVPVYYTLTVNFRLGDKEDREQDSKR